MDQLIIYSVCDVETWNVVCIPYRLLGSRDVSD